MNDFLFLNFNDFIFIIPYFEISGFWGFGVLGYWGHAGSISIISVS